MRLPRMTTRRWMIVIGVAALNLAAAHFLLAYDPCVLLGVALNGLVLQVALCGLARNRGIKRAFYAGFIAAGILSGGHFIWMWTNSHVLPPYYAATTSPSFSSRFLEACEELLEWPHDLLEELPYVYDVLEKDESAVGWIALTLLAFLPQILVAVGGGLLGLFIVWVIRLARRERIV